MNRDLKFHLNMFGQTPLQSAIEGYTNSRGYEKALFAQAVADLVAEQRRAELITASKKIPNYQFIMRDPFLSVKNEARKLLERADLLDSISGSGRADNADWLIEQDPIPNPKKDLDAIYNEPLRTSEILRENLIYFNQEPIRNRSKEEQFRRSQIPKIRSDENRFDLLDFIDSCDVAEQLLGNPIDIPESRGLDDSIAELLARIKSKEKPHRVTVSCSCGYCHTATGYRP